MPGPAIAWPTASFVISRTGRPVISCGDPLANRRSTGRAVLIRAAPPNEPSFDQRPSSRLRLTAESAADEKQSIVRLRLRLPQDPAAPPGNQLQAAPCLLLSARQL